MAAIYTSNTKPDTLKADTYIIYMMMGSYFNSCECDNSRMEKKLFLNYKDFSFNKQYTREERILGKIAALGDEYLDSLADMDVLACIKFVDDCGIVIFYMNDKIVLKANVDKKGVITFTI